MPNIDERVVSVAFENAKFEANVSKTISTLAKLEATLQGLGKTSGLSQLEAESHKVTMAAPMSALDKLKAKLGFGEGKAAFESLEASSHKATFTAPMSALDKLKAKLGFGEGKAAFESLEASSHRATFSAPMSALEKLKQKLGFGEAKAAFADLEASSHKVSFSGISGALDKVKAKMGFPEARSAFAELNAADDKVNFADAAAAVDGVSSKFSAMQVAGVTAFATIVSKATAGLSTLAGKVTGIQTIVEGFADYELKIGATQTIMAGTGEDIGTVTKYLKDLDTYADRTIYSLRDMTGNIGKFTNAGVKLPVAVDAMKGISNVAALSGANAGEAARAMYNLGQAIGQGTVRLMDWRSVELANMGTKEFKEELINAAIATGDLKKGADGLIRSGKGNIVNSKNFTSTLQDQWLTADALTNTLRKYADENTNLGKRAYAAATDVKTFSMMIETLGAAAGTGWTDTFDIILGDLPEATKLWTELTNTIGGFLGRTADARNEVLKAWDALGGRTALIEGIKNAWAAVMSVLTPLKDAFRDIFPRQTGQDLFDLTVKFRDFMANLKVGPETAENLRRTFAGLFAILHIGWTIIKEVAGVLFDLIGTAGKGSGGILNFTGSIGDFLVALDRAITEGGLLKGFFKTFGNVLKVPLELIKAIASAVSDMFKGTDSGGADRLGEAMANLTDKSTPLGKVVNTVRDAWARFVNILNKVKEAVEPMLTRVAEKLADFGSLVADAFKSADYSDVLAAIETTFIGGIFIAIKKAIGGGIGLDIGGGALEKLGNAIDGLTGNLKAMQQNVQAGTLLKIAAAILVLAAGILVLSTIDPEKLGTAMTAVAVGLGQLIGAMKLMTTGMGKLGIIQMPVIAASMVVLAGAVLILAGALKIMSTMSWEEMARGLTGVAGVLGAVGIGVKLIGPQILIVGPGLVPLALGMILLAGAVKIFAQMSWGELAAGLVGVAVALGGVALGMTLMPPTLPLIGIGLIAVSIGLSLLAGALVSFGSIDPKTMMTGLLGIASSLVVLGLAIMLIPPTLALQAAGLLIVAVALTVLSAAIAILGNMDVGTLVKGIIAMGGALVVLGLGLTFMSGTLAGSVALLAAAAALALLAPTLAFLGTLQWGTIFKGLAAIALTLGTLAVVGALAAVPLVALGGALAVLGLGLILVGGAVYLFAKGISLMKENVVKALAALVAAAGAFLLVFPKMVIDFVKGLVVILEEIVKLAPQIITALISIVTQLLGAIVTMAPQVASAIGALVTSILTVLNDNAPKLISAGFKLLQSLLSGIANNIGSIASKVGLIITRFLDSMSQQAPRIAQSGANLLIKFLNGVTSNIPRLVATVARLITTFINSVSAHIPRIVTAAANLITRFINAIGNSLPRIIKAGTDLIIKFLGGIQKAIPRIKEKALDVAETFLNNLADGLVRLARIGANALIKFLNGLADAIRDKQERIRKAGWNVASAIMEGILDGIKDLVGKVVDGVQWVIDKLPWAAKKALGIKSPSAVFADIGRNTMLGLVGGIDSGTGPVERSIDAATGTIVDTAKSSLAKVPDFLEGIMDMDPVITPVLDLSNVERGAQKLGDLTNVTPITAAASYTQAATISSDQQKIVDADAAAPVVATTFNYEQNNYSPDPLSNIEIYRRTNNQLAQVKNALGVTT